MNMPQAVHHCTAQAANCYPVQVPRFVLPVSCMGCLPLMVLFALGTGIGYVAAGPSGALWGAGAGLLLGLVSAAIMMKLIRAGR
jgi:hypothetical protein